MGDSGSRDDHSDAQNAAYRKARALHNQVTPNQPILFDSDVCDGCNVCIEACPIDVLIPNPEKGEAPVTLFPDECWYCGCCEMHCHLVDQGAITMTFPLMQRVRWKRKESGKHFRIGMNNPPPPNTRPPV